MYRISSDMISDWKSFQSCFHQNCSKENNYHNGCIKYPGYFEKFLSIFMLLVMWGSCQKIIPFLIFMANQHYEKFDVILYFTCFWILTNWKIILDLRVYTHWAKIKILMQKLDNHRRQTSGCSGCRCTHCFFGLVVS